MVTSKQRLLASVLESNFCTTTMEGTGGFIPFAVATQGLTGEQAATVPAERVNSVWAVVNHLHYLQDTFRKALLCEPTNPSMEAAWKPLGEVNDANWEAARQRTLASNQRLTEVIAALSDEHLTERLPGWFNNVTGEALVGFHGHISYHTGEIVTIRHMQGLWIEHLFA